MILRNDIFIHFDLPYLVARPIVAVFALVPVLGHFHVVVLSTCFHFFTRIQSAETDPLFNCRALSLVSVTEKSMTFL